MRHAFCAVSAICFLVLALTVHVQAADVDIEMVSVAGGCFQMGDTFGDGREDEKPVHEVCVGDFSLGRYEVTQAEWEAVMGTRPSRFTGVRRPATQVNWDEAQAFIKKLNTRTGSRYRLPTEAEWEYAARSGGKRERWAGTSDLSQVGDYAWFLGNSGDGPHAVGTKSPNGLGIYDMSGNAWEWVEDHYSDVWYKESPKDNPKGPKSGSTRVLRGGSWDYYARDARTAFRRGVDLLYRGYDIGFRLAGPGR